MMKKLLTGIVTTFALLASVPASAQPNYPSVVQDSLQAVRKPPCKVCHGGGITGFGTVDTHFGLQMMRNGMKSFDEQSVRDALYTFSLYASVQSLKRDDKTLDDLEVLRRGGDPNEETPVYFLEAPEYGCGGATFTGHTPRALPVPIVAIVASLAALVYRRRRRAPGP
jgi:hypothetical protein